MAGLVESCAADEDGCLLVIVQVFDWVAQVTPHSQAFRGTEDLDIWPAEELVIPRVWYWKDANLVLVF